MLLHHQLTMGCGADASMHEAAMVWSPCRLAQPPRCSQSSTRDRRQTPTTTCWARSRGWSESCGLQWRPAPTWTPTRTSAEASERALMGSQPDHQVETLDVDDLARCWSEWTAVLWAGSEDHRAAQCQPQWRRHGGPVVAVVAGWHTEGSRSRRHPATDCSGSAPRLNCMTSCRCHEVSVASGEDEVWDLLVRPRWVWWGLGLLLTHQTHHLSDVTVWPSVVGSTMCCCCWTLTYELSLSLMRTLGLMSPSQPHQQHKQQYFWFLYRVRMILASIGVLGIVQYLLVLGCIGYWAILFWSVICNTNTTQWVLSSVVHKFLHK